MSVPNSSGKWAAALDGARECVRLAHPHLRPAVRGFAPGRAPHPKGDGGGLSPPAGPPWHLAGRRRAAAAYGFDNAVTIDAVAQLGLTKARAVAVVPPTISDAELAEMDRVGVRGVRFTQHDPSTAVTTPDMIEPVAARIAALGWHVQLHLRGEQLVAMAEVIARLPCTLVLDTWAGCRNPRAWSTRPSRS
jgi:hypothetical protein